MSAKEHPALRKAYEWGLSSGEVTGFSGDGFSVDAHCSPGQACIKFPVGADVYVLTVDELVELISAADAVGS